MKIFDATILLESTTKISANNEKEAREKIKAIIPSSCPGNTKGTTVNLKIADIYLTELRIMDGSTSHNKSLVEQVNKCYAMQHELFFDIIRLLSSRDRDEFVGDVNPNTACMKDIAHYYLHAIADDEDLRAIIHYCRVF
jgi:hypothetical protein